MEPVEIKEIYRERAGEIEMTKKYNEQLEKIQLISFLQMFFFSTSPDS